MKNLEIGRYFLIILYIYIYIYIYARTHARACVYVCVCVCVCVFIEFFVNYQGTLVGAEFTYFLGFYHSVMRIIFLIY